MLHTDRPATAVCTECSRPLCQECTQLVAGKPVCQSCLTAIRSRVATQLNAEATSQRTAQPLPPQPPSLPYGSPGAYPPVGQQPVAPPYDAARTDLAGNSYSPPPGSQYAPQQPPLYGAPQNPAYPPQQPQAPGYNPQAPYGTSQQPHPGHNPYGAGQQGRPPVVPQPAVNPGTYVLGIVFGLLAAIVGGVLYVVVAQATHITIGYMALGIGFLVGWAVKMGTRMPSQAAGILAVVLTVIGILPGEIYFYRDPTDILFTALFLFIGCRWAYRIAARGN